MIATTDKLFPKLTAHQMNAAIEAGEELVLKDGDVIFREGGERADFFVILEGKIKVVRRGEGDSESVLVIHDVGDFTGTTDLLTGEASTATGFALGPTRVARVRFDRFNELILSCPQMREVLIPALAERRHAQYAITTQQQKLAALGKMSAGLAHELNNPAAAARRSAQTLTAALEEVEELCCDLLNSVAARESGNIPLTDICELARRNGKEIDPVTRSDREDELSGWLASLQIPQPWDAAASLVSAGLSRQDLEPLAKSVPPALARKLISWLAKDVEIRQTCQDLTSATGRITEIVQAMKAYTHMDQAHVKAPTDLHAGIDTTLTILKHKAKTKDLKLIRDYGVVPPIYAIGGELNQVWTNLLDNAIDAAPEGGMVKIHTAREGDDALIEITDNGKGIAPEIRSRIFEPFFTTKGVGEGTGLGLDTSYRIVKGHGGDIHFESRPGETRFIVRLPLKS
jgi:signal transduction histidine kinase